MKKIIIVTLLLVLGIGSAYADDWALVKLAATVESVTFNFMVNGQTGTASETHPHTLLSFNGINPLNQNAKHIAGYTPTGAAFVPVAADVYWNINSTSYRITVSSNASDGGLINYADGLKPNLPLELQVVPTTNDYSATGTWNAFSGVTTVVDGVDASGAGLHRVVYFRSDFTGANPGDGYGAALTFKLERY